jgi:hypothetical protein
MSNEAIDTRFRGAPADIESPPRLIEVKACGKPTARGDELLMEVRQVEQARRNPNFYVYVVENVRQGNPAEFALRVLGGPRLQRLLERAKEYRYYGVPGRSPTTALARGCRWLMLGLARRPNACAERSARVGVRLGICVTREEYARIEYGGLPVVS